VKKLSGKLFANVEKKEKEKEKKLEHKKDSFRKQILLGPQRQSKIPVEGQYVQIYFSYDDAKVEPNNFRLTGVLKNEGDDVVRRHSVIIIYLIDFVFISLIS
jgi:hypothetical protein